jgi:hypothetical protein
VHPVTAERIELQLSADRDERLAKLAGFLREPGSCSMHYPKGAALGESGMLGALCDLGSWAPAKPGATARPWMTIAAG